MRKILPLRSPVFFCSRVLLAVVLCMGIACLIAAATSGKFALVGREAPGNAFQRTLSFEERVSYQRAFIEDVRTQRTVFKHSLRTTPAKTTRQTVMVRSLAIRPATTTRPTAFKRSLAIPSA